MTTWAGLRLGEVAANFAKFTRPHCKPALSPFPFATVSDQQSDTRKQMSYSRLNVRITWHPKSTVPLGTLIV
jgi:hypothetical protein